MKTKTYWLGKRKNFDTYELGRKKDQWTMYFGFGLNIIRGFCEKEWIIFSGIRLKEGQCAKVKVSQLENGFIFEVVK